MEKLNQGLQKFQVYFLLYLLFLLVVFLHYTSISDFEIFISKAPLGLEYNSIPLQLNFLTYFIFVPLALVVVHGITLYLMGQLFRLSFSEIPVSALAFLPKLIKYSIANQSSQKNDLLMLSAGFRIFKTHKPDHNPKPDDGKIGTYTLSATECVFSFLLYISLFILPTVVLFLFFFQYLKYGNVSLSIIHLTLMGVDLVFLFLIGGKFLYQIKYALERTPHFKNYFTVIQVIMYPIALISSIAQFIFLVFPIYLHYLIKQKTGQAKRAVSKTIDRVWFFKFQVSVFLLAFVAFVFFYFALSQDSGRMQKLAQYYPCFPAIELNGYYKKIEFNPTMTSRNFAFIRINHINFNRVNLEGSNFSSAFFNDVSFTNCNFSKCILDQAIFKEVKFYNCRFNEMVFKPLYIKGSSFINCEFKHTNLTALIASKINFDSTQFINSEIIGNYLDHCTHRNNQFVETTIAWNILENNDYSGSTFDESLLYANQLDLANFNGSAWCKNLIMYTTLEGARFRAVDLRNTRILYSNLLGSHFDLCLLADFDAKVGDLLIYNGSRFDYTYGALFIDSGYVDKIGGGIISNSVAAGLKYLASGTHNGNSIKELPGVLTSKYLSDTFQQSHESLNLRQRKAATSQFEDFMQTQYHKISEVSLNSDSNYIHIQKARFTICTSRDSIAQARYNYLQENERFNQALTRWCITKGFFYKRMNR